MSRPAHDVSLRAIPSVDRVLRELGETDLPRPVTVAVVRRELDAVRSRGRDGAASDVAGDATARVRRALDDLRRSRLGPVINGTGIIIHTNLGRSPLGPKVVRAVTEAAENYSSLEYDLTGGSRGGRAAYLEHNLAVLCGAPAATVVNNCAAALVLVLRHFAAGESGKDQVVISRGELVQIGGGFRIPEILRASGAMLCEIGTTNQTTLDDYQRAIGPRTAMILKVHRSNFYMDGFVASPGTRQIATLAAEHDVPFVEDLGSGSMTTWDQPNDPAKDDQARRDKAPGAPRPERRPGSLPDEPTVPDTLRQGADLVTFSGDKLFGGPQAGIIAGREDLVAALKREPFFRALRCDKLILAALQATVDLHLDGATDQIPTLAMMNTPRETLLARGGQILLQLAGTPLLASLADADSQVGGGSLPRTTIPSVTLDLIPRHVALDPFAAALRAQSPPVIGYVSAGRLRIDLRTVFARQDDALVAALSTAAQHPSP